MFRRLKIISVFLLLFLIFLPSLAQSQTAVGKFTFVQGRVDILRQPAPRAMPVKMGDAVFVGDIIRAKSGSKAEITFKDGNIVRVAPNTRVEISEYMFDEAKGKGILKLSRGKVQAIIQEKIAKRIATFGEANRFEIHTPTAILGVRGTNFVVLYQRNSSSVFVWEGTVLAYSPKFPDMAVTVNAGYVTTIPLDQPAQPARPATDAEKKMYEGDFAQTEGSGEKSEAEDTVISEATTAPAEPGVPEPGPESLIPMGTLTDTPGGDLTQIVQPPPFTETVGSDTTPPVINITGPPDLSNLPVSSFNVTSDETVTFTYRMESWGAISPKTTSDKFDLEGLIDGTYTLIVTATDQVGNSSTASYTWTVDRTKPNVSIASSPPFITNSDTANFDISVDDQTATITYKLDDNTVSSPNLTGIIEGDHTFTVTATDKAYNESTKSYSWFIGKRQYVLKGGTTGSLSGSVLPTSEGLRIVSNGTQGAWQLGYSGAYNGTMPGSLDLVSGGEGYSPNSEEFNGYWLSKIDHAVASSEIISGTSSFKYLSTTVLGEGTGIVSGTYGSPWQITDLGLGTYTETPLAFGGGVGSELFEWDPIFYLVGNRTLIGLMGGTESLWTGTSPFLSLGTYDTESLYNGALWGVDIGAEPSGFISDGGTFLGIMGGISLNDNLEGRALALYIKPNGEGYETGYILSDNVIGSLYPEIGMYELGGNLISLSMGTTEISPSDLNWDGLYGETPSLHIAKGYGTIEGDLEGEIGSQYINLTDQNWGAWWATSVSYYTEENPLIPSTWIATAEGEIYDADLNEVGIWGSQITSSRIDTDNKLIGTSVGYLADISSTPITAISVGETFGTFDPNAYTWQAVSMGAWIETNKFLQMTQSPEGIAKLQQLNIPCVEVGRATLTGSGNNFSNLNMTDTIFFAPSTGAKPTIWATGNVNGSYSSAPTINTPVGLSGGGLNADFTFKQWDASNNKWLSSVNGTGGFNGSASFQGAGAGTLTNPSGAGTISGTAAGVAR